MSSEERRGDTRVYRPSAPVPRLRVLTGPAADAGREFALDRPSVTIGRQSDQVIVLRDPSVSRAHARIEIDRHGATIVDLGSTNGTAVNGLRVQDRAALRGGDHIKIGGVVLEYLAAS